MADISNIIKVLAKITENTISEDDAQCQATTESDLQAFKENLQRSDYSNIAVHNDEFTELLKSYTSFVDETLKNKVEMKKRFFWLSFFTLIAVSTIMVGSIISVFWSSWQENFSIEDYILPVLTSLCSFLAAFIIIPKIIAKYLFNSKEEKVMKDIVNSIQQYDKDVRDDLNNKPR